MCIIKKVIYILFILTIFIASAKSGTIDPANNDESYIEYAENFDCVLQLTGMYGNVIFNASCVAINDNMILTAAHVVEKASDCYVLMPKRKNKIIKIIYHKDFDTNKFGIADIALCICEDPMNFKDYPILYSDRDEIGKKCSISGFGVTGDFITGAKISDGKKRAGLNYIDYIQQELLVCSPSRDKNKTSLEFIISHGDSGGGLFINNKLAGINSSVMAIDKKTDSSYTDESCHTRISTYIPWIKEIINNEKK